MISIILSVFSLITFTQDSLKLDNKFGSFRNPVSVSASREEFIYVSDTQSDQIFKFSASGELLSVFGGTGFGSNELNKPMSVDASNGLDVYIADYQNNRIQRLDLNLNFISSFDFKFHNLTSSSTARIHYPYGVVSLSTSEIFVLADAGTYRVVKLNSFADVTLLFGTTFKTTYKLADPSKVVKGSSLDIWVLDKGEDVILNLDNFGTYIKKLENPEKNRIISIAFYNDYLYILYERTLILYDLKPGKFTGYYKFNVEDAPVRDICALSKEVIIILTGKQVCKFTFKK